MLVFFFVFILSPEGSVWNVVQSLRLERRGGDRVIRFYINLLSRRVAGNFQNRDLIETCPYPEVSIRHGIKANRPCYETVIFFLRFHS